MPVLEITVSRRVTTPRKKTTGAATTWTPWCGNCTKPSATPNPGYVSASALLVFTAILNKILKVVRPTAWVITTTSMPMPCFGWKRAGLIIVCRSCIGKSDTAEPIIKPLPNGGVSWISPVPFMWDRTLSGRWIPASYRKKWPSSATTTAWKGIVSGRPMNWKTIPDTLWTAWWWIIIIILPYLR